MIQGSDSQSVVPRSASPGNSLEMQTLGSHPDLLCSHLGLGSGSEHTYWVMNSQAGKSLTWFNLLI